MSSPLNFRKIILQLEANQVEGTATKDKVCMEDVDIALSYTRPSANVYQERYVDWQDKYGSVS